MYNLSTVIERINTECKKKGISVNQMLIASMAGKSLVDNMKRGRSPSIDKLYLVASFLDTTSDYLLGLSDSPNAPSQPPTIKTAAGDEQRQRLNDNYDRMNEKGQQTLLSFAGYLIQQPENLKEGGEDNQNVS